MEERQAIVNQILEQTRRIEGRSRVRCFNAADAEAFLAVLESHPGARIVRRYAHGGFVANSYGYASLITRLTAYRDSAGAWRFSYERCDAKLPCGAGALTLVNNRAVEE